MKTRIVVALIVLFIAMPTLGQVIVISRGSSIAYPLQFDGSYSIVCVNYCDDFIAMSLTVDQTTGYSSPFGAANSYLIFLGILKGRIYTPLPTG